MVAAGDVDRLTEAADQGGRPYSGLSGSPSALLRRGPLRTERATFTALGSSKPLGRSLSACCGPWPDPLACDAVKILCRRRRTRSSAAGQSTADQSKTSPSGPFTTPTPAASTTGARAVSNLSFGSSVASKAFSTDSPDPRQHPFRSGHRPVSGQLYETTARGGGIWSRFPVAFRPPAFACWVILPPLGHSAFLTVDAPDNSCPDSQRDCHVPHDQDSTGEGAPIPRDKRCLRPVTSLPVSVRRFSTACPTPAPNKSHRRVQRYGASTGIHSRSPVQSSPFTCSSQMGQEPFGLTT